MLEVMLETIQIAIQMQRVILIAEQKVTHLILDVVNNKKDIQDYMNIFFN